LTSLSLAIDHTHHNQIQIDNTCASFINPTPTFKFTPHPSRPVGIVWIIFSFYYQSLKFFWNCLFVEINQFFSLLRIGKL
jgi:hypothetical protein